MQFLRHLLLIKGYMKKIKSQENISKEKLIEILDGAFLQIIWIRLCIDELLAIQEIDNDKLKIANNFIYITHSSLIYRYTMELAKLFGCNEQRSIYKICQLCSEHLEYFDVNIDFDLQAFCKEYERTIKEYKDTTDNIIKRRNKVYAHNDEIYYLYNEQAIKDYPIDFNEVKQLSAVLYDLVKTLQIKIGSRIKDATYPVNTDDVKRLFGLKTKDDLFIENVKW